MKLVNATDWEQLFNKFKTWKTKKYKKILHTHWNRDMFHFAKKIEKKEKKSF